MDAIKLTKDLVDMFASGGCPLTEDQHIMLVGSLSVFVPHIQKDYREGDFSAIARTTEGDQVLIHVDQTDDGDPALKIATYVDGTFVAMTMGPLESSVINAALRGFSTKQADDMRKRLVAATNGDLSGVGYRG